MKITFVKPVVTQNGGSRVVAIYAEKLKAMGHDVTVVSRAATKMSLKRRLINRLKGVTSPDYDPDRTAYYDVLGSSHVQLPWRFPLRAADVPDADVVIATWWRTAFEVSMLPASKGKKAYFVQGHEVFHGQGDLGAGSYYLPLKKIVISKWIDDIMAQDYGQTDTIKVPNAIDNDQFHAPERAKMVAPTVGFIYSTKHIKGSDVALQSIEKLRRVYPNLQVVCFGAAAPDKALPLPPASRFVQLPKQEDISKLYAACDAWIMSSRTEGFGLPILEAMACRTPVVATRTGAAEDLIKDGVNGFVVDIDDSDAMADRLGHILACNAADWSAMSQAAHATATDYNWNDATIFFEKALQRIVAAS